MKKIATLAVIVLIGALAYIYRDYADNIVQALARRYLPCRTSISYAVGAFDERFGISREEFQAALAEGEEIWEKAADMDLFLRKERGELIVNLVYDERQEITLRLRNLGIEIATSREVYNEVKSKYEELYEDYRAAQAAFEKMLAGYDARRDKYESSVAYWNARGGAPKEEYEKLAAERDDLRAELVNLKKAEANINELVANVNALVETLNRLAADLNLNARRYNTIGAAQEEEFEEGSYTTGPTGSAINIYQFENRGKLVRVIAHEFGHALGIPHLDDPEAIMYRLNQGEVSRPSDADIEALKQRCSIKSRI